MKLTEAQKRALQSAVDHGDPTHHLRGRSEHGGYTKTDIFLVKHGLLNREGRITDAGRAALREGSEG